MAKIKILVDTDIYIDYFNTRLFRKILEGKEFTIYYSIVTRKELLSKRGLKGSEKRVILYTLNNHRLIKLEARIAKKYSELRQIYPHLDKEDTLIAATAMIKNLPLMTRNWKHYKSIKGLILFVGKTV